MNKVIEKGASVAMAEAKAEGESTLVPTCECSGRPLRKTDTMSMKNPKHATSLPAHDSCLDTWGEGRCWRGWGRKGGMGVGTPSRDLSRASAQGRAQCGWVQAGRHRLRVPANCSKISRLRWRSEGGTTVCAARRRHADSSQRVGERAGLLGKRHLVHELRRPSRARRPSSAAAPTAEQQEGA